MLLDESLDSSALPSNPVLEDSELPISQPMQDAVTFNPPSSSTALPDCSSPPGSNALAPNSEIYSFDLAASSTATLALSDRPEIADLANAIGYVMTFASPGSTALAPPLDSAYPGSDVLSWTTADVSAAGQLPSFVDFASTIASLQSESGGMETPTYPSTSSEYSFPSTSSSTATQGSSPASALSPAPATCAFGPSSSSIEGSSSAGWPPSFPSAYMHSSSSADAKAGLSHPPFSVRFIFIIL